jgi:hypothetical protein
MFHPQYGGKRGAQVPVPLPNAPVMVQPGVVAQPGAVAQPIQPTVVGQVGPVASAAPVRGFRRFGR